MREMGSGLGTHREGGGCTPQTDRNGEPSYWGWEGSSWPQRGELALPAIQQGPGSMYDLLTCGLRCDGSPGQHRPRPSGTTRAEPFLHQLSLFSSLAFWSWVSPTFCWLNRDKRGFVLPLAQVA